MRELEELVEVAKVKSRKIIESGEEHGLVILALTPGGTAIIGTNIDEDKKEIFKDTISAVLLKLDASAYVMVCEAWETRISHDSPLLNEISSGRVKISELPLDDKTEVLMITVAERCGPIYQWTSKIKYSNDDKRYLDDWHKLSEEPEGRMIVREW